MSLSTTTPRLKPAAEATPTRLGALLFDAKVWAHRGKRLLHDLRHGPARLGQAPAGGFVFIAGRTRTALWSDTLTQERTLQLGKVQNLRRAAAALDGVLIPQGAVFSFWKQLGRASRRGGYVPGRMLQQGCMVPAVGGGLCQLSNALYEAALQAGCEIVERHAHSRIVPGSQAALGRDATVAWNYVDLRFRARHDMRLQVRLDRNDLLVRFSTRRSVERQPAGPYAVPAGSRTAQSCDTCNEVDCFRHIGPAALAMRERTAFMLDGMTAEFATYVARMGTAQDALAIPIDGQRWRLPRYAWQTDGFTTTYSAPFATLQRSFESRRLADQGAIRQRALLRHAERLALALARQLPADVTGLCVAQPLLPFLWRHGDIGGRALTILMSRLPMSVLQARLDAALRRHPQSPTLGDFRAPPDLAEAEDEALAYADRIVTPHAEIAALFPGKAELLGWHMAKTNTAPPAPHRIAFAGPTLGRKGAYEMRQAAHSLGLELAVPARDLETADFWAGMTVHRIQPGMPLWQQADILVQPAYVEDSPRTLLAALAHGRQVIATPACGLPPQAGLTLVTFGDAAALIAALGAVSGR